MTLEKELMYEKSMENHINGVGMDRGHNRGIYDGFYHCFCQYI